jgi:acyl-CoA synthetase (NDP forming)
MVDLGNMCDVDESEVLDYLGGDPQTRVILLHIEGIREGQRFMGVASEVAQKKPVIALKVGRSATGAEAVVSHTGSLAGKDEVHDASFQQVGIVRAMDLDEVIDFTKTFACLSPLPTGKRIGMITFSGTAGVLAADACEEFGLSLAQLSEASIEKVKDIIPSWASVENPIDVGRVIDPEVIARAYPTVLEAFSEDPNVDAVLVMAMTISTQPEFSNYNVLREYAEKGPKKPTVVTGLGDYEGSKELSSLELKGLVTYPTVRRAVKALAVAYSRHRFLSRFTG